MSAPKNTSVLKGQSFSISFDYLAIPAPNFTWYINDVVHHKVNSTSEARSNHTMTFTNANEEGWYRCMVQNDLATTEYTVFVDILSKILDDLHNYILMTINLYSTTSDHCNRYSGSCSRDSCYIKLYI